MIPELVSIVVPVYNCANSLRRCLASLVEQTYPFIEIIVIDDGSTDGSNELCDEIAEGSQTIRIVHQSNHGPAYARNVGISLSLGKYLMFVDGDDYIDRNAVRTLVLTALNTNADYIVFDCSPFNVFGPLPRKIAIPRKFPTISSSRTADCLKEIYSEKIGNYSWAFFYRLQTLIESGIVFPNNVRVLEDMVFLNKLLRTPGKVVYLDEQLYHYRISSDSLSHTTNTQFVKASYNAVTEIISLAKDDNSIAHFSPHCVKLLFFLDAMLSHSSESEANSLSKEIRLQIIQLFRFTDTFRVGLKTVVKILLLHTSLYDTIARVFRGNS